MFARFLFAAAALFSTVLADGSHAGDGTFFDVGLGACGITSTADQMVVAIAHDTFDNYPGATANPNLNPICGQQVRAYYNGKSVDVTIVDRCAGCNGAFDLDFSRGAFDKIADQGLGRIQITWDWLTGVSSGVLQPTNPPATTPTTTTVAPPTTTTGAEACSPEGAIRCPNENSWEICGSGRWQYNGQLAYPYLDDRNAGNADTTPAAHWNRVIPAPHHPRPISRNQQLTPSPTSPASHTMSTTSLQTSMGQQQVEQPLPNRGYRSYLPNPLVDTNGAAAGDSHSSPRSADLSGPPRWETFPHTGHNPNGPSAVNGGSRGYFDSGHGPVQLPSPTERLAPPQDTQREPSSGPDRRRHRSSPVAYANAASPSTYHARHGSEGADSSATFSSNSSGPHPRHHSDGANGTHRCMSPRLAPILGEPAAPASPFRLPPIVDHPSDKGAVEWNGHMAWRMTPQGPVAAVQGNPPIMSHPPSSDGPLVNDPARPRHAHVQSDVTDVHPRVHHPVPRLKTKTKLTTERRKDICRYAAMNPSARQEDIATVFSIERSTVSKILKHRKEWLARPDDEAERAKNRPIKYPIIEQHLEEDLERWRRERKPITDIAIKRRALEIAQDPNIYSPEHSEFKASQGWVEAFKQRYGIKSSGS
ncbi:hypothetical protein GGF50DRAFT_91604 [Schizophyllum commune]